MDIPGKYSDIKDPIAYLLHSAELSLEHKFGDGTPLVKKVYEDPQYSVYKSADDYLILDKENKQVLTAGEKSKTELVLWGVYPASFLSTLDHLGTPDPANAFAAFIQDTSFILGTHPSNLFRINFAEIDKTGTSTDPRYLVKKRALDDIVKKFSK